MTLLTLNGKTFSIEELNTISPDLGESEFEKSTLRFCKAWVNRQSEFTVQTSGSTGIPKEIVLTHQAMETSARATVDALKLKSGGISLVCLDTKYIAGQMMLVRSLINDMNIIAVEPSANPLAHNNEVLDFTALVPYQLENILEQTPEKLNQVRSAIIGGAAVGNLLHKKIQNSKCKIYATYGMTETISHIALQKLNGSDRQEYFEAFDGVNLRLDDRECLCIKTAYLSDEVITNDIVELHNEKKFKWLGRIDHVINSGGVKIIPEKVEGALENILGQLGINNRFFVGGLPDKKLGQRAVIVFERAQLSKEMLQRILNELHQSLSKYEVPKEFIFINQFTETNTGKVNRMETLNKSSNREHESDRQLTAE